MTAEEHLLLILHEPPTPEDDERVGRFFWREPDGTWSSSVGGNGVSALVRHFDEYSAELEKFDTQAENDHAPLPFWILVIVGFAFGVVLTRFVANHSHKKANGHAKR